MNVVVTAGGGGHFAAALAAIDSFPKGWEVTIIGRKHPFEGDKALSFELQTAQKRGISFYPLITGRLQRTITKHTIPSLLKVPIGFVQALRFLQKKKPDVVLSFGGYVSVPVVWAAALMHIPVIIHEQTLQAGLANKLAAPFAQKICLSWDASTKYFPKEKVVVTGNPLVTNYESRIKNYEKHEKLPMIFITGGSAGAHAINLLIEECLTELVAQYQIVHQTGDAKEFTDYERLHAKRMRLPATLQDRYQLSKSLTQEEMWYYLQEATLVISRSGMGTVTQLLSLGKPCLLIPLPYGQRGEQRANAAFIKGTGIAEVMDQQKLTPDLFKEKIAHMISTIADYHRHAADAKALIHHDAAHKIRDIISYVSQKENSQER